MVDIRFDGESLGVLRNDLGTFVDRLTGVRDASAGSTGAAWASTSAHAMHDFGKTWQYGVGRLGDHASDARSMLKGVLDAFARVDAELRVPGGRVTRVALPTLGFDPAPGEIDEIRAVVRLLGDAAGEVRNVHRAVRDAGSGTWVGQAATAFHDHLQRDFAPKLATVTSAFSEASRTVPRWQDDREAWVDACATAAEIARSLSWEGDASASQEPGADRGTPAGP